MKRKTAFIALFILSSLIVTSAFNQNSVKGAEPIANLVFKTNGGGVRPDYGLFIAQYLRDIGIEVEVKVEEWSVFVGTLLLTHDYDIGVVGLSGGGASPEMRSVYGENGSLNMYGLGIDLPYGEESEDMQDIGVTITDLDVRQQHYYDWQQLMMDKIVPQLPLFSPRSYVGTWANTLGYEGRWGLVDSMPYMSYDGLHAGQVDDTEFTIADANWRELNPLFTDDTSSSFVWALESEPILQFSPDLQPLKTGLIEDWEQIDEFHYKFTMRDDVYWNPSYNVTLRDASSIELAGVPTGELMTGLKDPLVEGDGEYSDGTNQQVTAKDAVFTYLAWGNDVISEDPSLAEWISGCWVDPINELQFHLTLDGIPDDPGKPESLGAQHYVDFWSGITFSILPEFFLNSTDPTVSYTNGLVECTGLYAGMETTPEWLTFSTSAFGAGKFMLDYYVRSSVTVLQKSPYWFGVGAFEGNTGLEPFVDTFNIRVIPDTSAELAEFKAGKLDWTGLTAFPTERKQMQADPNFDVQTFVSDSNVFMFFNLRRPFVGGEGNFVYLDEPGKEEYTVGIAIRKAICYAIDREEMNQVLHDGEYLLTHSVIYPYTAFYHYDDIIKYDYDIWAAFEWLGAAGYTVPTKPITTTEPIETTPFPVFGIIAAIGAASVIALYRKRK